jgi:predicted HicB family RNase H-like nuclease
MSKEERKNMYVGARITANFYKQLQNYMKLHGFENVSEFLRYCMRKVLESQKEGKND